MRIHFKPAALARAAALAGLTAMAPFAVAAESATTQAEPLSGMAPIPEVQKKDNVEYLIGGVGVDERQQIKPLVKDMNLQMVFAEKQTGGYLADVEVVIADSKGEQVLKVSQSDPMVFAALEPGTYSVTAKSAKGTMEREIKVPASGRRTELFLWG